MIKKQNMVSNQVFFCLLSKKCHFLIRKYH